MAQFQRRVEKLGGSNPYRTRNRFHQTTAELLKIPPTENCTCSLCNRGLWCS